jgi:hypothetical protein
MQEVPHPQGRASGWLELDTPKQLRTLSCRPGRTVGLRKECPASVKRYWSGNRERCRRQVRSHGDCSGSGGGEIARGKRDGPSRPQQQSLTRRSWISRNSRVGDAVGPGGNIGLPPKRSRANINVGSSNRKACLRKVRADVNCPRIEGRISIGAGKRQNSTRI